MARWNRTGIISINHRKDMKSKYSRGNNFRKCLETDDNDMQMYCVSIIYSKRNFSPF